MSAVRTASADGVTMPLPDGWEQTTAPGLGLVLVGPAGLATAGGDLFRPSVSALVAATAPGTDVRTLGTEAVVAAQTAGAHVLAYDVWPCPRGSARRLVLATQHGPIPVCVTQWVALRDGQVTTLTATCAITQLERLAALIEAMAAEALGSPEVSR